MRCDADAGMRVRRGAALPYRPCPRHRRTNERTNERTNRPTVSLCSPRPFPRHIALPLCPLRGPASFPVLVVFFFLSLFLRPSPLCSHTTDTRSRSTSSGVGTTARKWCTSRCSAHLIDSLLPRSTSDSGAGTQRARTSRPDQCQTARRFARRAPGGRRGAPPRPPPVSPALEEAGPPERTRANTPLSLDSLPRSLVLSRYVARSRSTIAHFSPCRTTTRLSGTTSPRRRDPVRRNRCLLDNR